jgi:hypothetical protein
MPDSRETGSPDGVTGRGLPLYESPKVTLMDRDEVLEAFQMTAAQISAAGCWWSPGCTGSVCKYD